MQQVAFQSVKLTKTCNSEAKKKKKKKKKKKD
jgi:hypothetical protein